MVRMFADDTKLFANTSIEGMNSKVAVIHKKLGKLGKGMATDV